MEKFPMLGLAALAVSATLAAAAQTVCDKTFNLLSARQTLITLTEQKAVQSQKTTALDPAKALTDIQVLSDSINYKLLVNFQTSCGQYAPRKATFRTKAKAPAGFGWEDSTLKVRIFDSSEAVLGTTGFKVWVHLTADTANLYSDDAFGGKAGQPLTKWIGAVKFVDSTQTATGSKRSESYIVADMADFDSASLYQRLLEPWAASHPASGYARGYFLQILKVDYDTVAAAANIQARRNAGPRASFHATQAGPSVLIEVAGAGEGQALSLYNMLGAKVATLHPTGYAYMWDGKVSMGAPAPAGVYFVRAGDKALGKFFYNPPR